MTQIHYKQFILKDKNQSYIRIPNNKFVGVSRKSSGMEEIIVKLPEGNLHYTYEDSEVADDDYNKIVKELSKN